MKDSIAYALYKNQQLSINSYLHRVGMQTFWIQAIVNNMGVKGARTVFHSKRRFSNKTWKLFGRASIYNKNLMFRINETQNGQNKDINLAELKVVYCNSPNDASYKVPQKYGKQSSYFSLLCDFLKDLNRLR